MLTIYTADWCPLSKNTLDYLESHGIAYEKIPLSSTTDFPCDTENYHQTHSEGDSSSPNVVNNHCENWQMYNRP